MLICGFFADQKEKERAEHASSLCQNSPYPNTAFFFFKFADKSGVLIVKILEMFEECMIQVAICQQLEESPAIVSSRDLVIHTREPILKVLFARETAAHLKSRPQDVIHIYPPW